MTKKMWFRISVFLMAAVAIMMLHPLTRPIVFFLLPLGIKPDDLIMWGMILLWILIPFGIVGHIIVNDDVSTIQKRKRDHYHYYEEIDEQEWQYDEPNF